MKTRMIAAAVAASTALALAPAVQAAPAAPSGQQAAPTEQGTDQEGKKEIPTVTVNISGFTANGATNVVNLRTHKDVASRLNQDDLYRWTSANPDNKAIRVTPDGRMYITTDKEEKLTETITVSRTADNAPVLTLNVVATPKAVEASEGLNEGPRKAEAGEIAATVGIILGIVGLLAGMIQTLVPGGWAGIVDFIKQGQAENRA